MAHRRPRRSGGTAASASFDLERYRPDRGGVSGGGRARAVSAPGWWSCATVVVHHELDDALEAKGVTVCDLATCSEEQVRATLGTCSDASPDAFTVLHDAFLAGRCVRAGARRCGGRAADRRRAPRRRGGRRGQLPAHRRGPRRGGPKRPWSNAGRRATRPEQLVDAVVELVVGDAAHLRYVSVQEHGPGTWQVALQRAHVGRDASLRSSAVALGGDYAAPAQRVVADGSRAPRPICSPSTSATTPRCSTSARSRTTTRPHTRSDLLFKGAVEDRARSVYSGLVRLRPDAQHSSAFQTNRNLVLTEGAGAESIPNLEIEANDVRCSHASAVGPIDDDQLYYLESRGIPPEEAERLIVLGFFDDVFARLPVAALTGSLRRSVVDKIERRSGVKDHRDGDHHDRVCSTGDVALSGAALRRRRVPAFCVVHLETDSTGAWHVIDDPVLLRGLLVVRGASLADECEIECPKHGSTFSLVTGEPQTLPATRSGPVYRSRSSTARSWSPSRSGRHERAISGQMYPGPGRAWPERPGAQRQERKT